MYKFHSNANYNQNAAFGLLYQFFARSVAQTPSFTIHSFSIWVTILHCLPKNRYCSAFIRKSISISFLLLQGSLIVTRLGDPKAARTTSLPSIPLSLGAASLSCLAAEHHQIHNEESLDAWRAKAIRTIDDLYEQKASYLRHEAHLNALLGQLRAIIDEDKQQHGSNYFLDDHPPVQKTPNGFRK